MCDLLRETFCCPLSSLSLYFFEIIVFAFSKKSLCNVISFFWLTIIVTVILLQMNCSHTAIVPYLKFVLDRRYFRDFCKIKIFEEPHKLLNQGYNFTHSCEVMGRKYCQKK